MTDESLAKQILEVIPLVMRTVAAEMRQSDYFVVPAHFRLLWLLKHRSHSLSELAEHQAVSLPTMSNSVTTLEERGWARRSRSETDRRKVLIEITPAGQAVLAQVHQQMEQRVSEIIQSLNIEDQAAVSHGLHILHDAFMDVMPPAHECKEK